MSTPPAIDWKEAREIALRSIEMGQTILNAVNTSMGQKVSPKRPAASAAQVVVQVAAWFHLSGSDLRQKTRRQEMCWPRQVAMYFARELTDASLNYVGGLFAHKNHTTVDHACRCVRNRMESEVRTKADLDKLREHLNANFK